MDNQQNPGNLTLNQNIPVLYTDSIYISINEYGVMLDVAQGAASTNQQVVVARIGMSKDHAKALIKMLEKRLSEAEKSDSKKSVSDKKYFA